MMTDKFHITSEATDIASNAIRLDNDVNGNPRYYLSVCEFWNGEERYRPFGAVAYRGKKYGAGWVFQSYSLAYDIQHALNHRTALGLKHGA